MKHTEDTSPATNGDLNELFNKLVDRFGNRFDAIDKNLESHTEKLDTIDAQFEVVLEFIEQSTESLKNHIDQGLEVQSRSLSRISRQIGEAITNHEERLRVVEHGMGVTP